MPFRRVAARQGNQVGFDAIIQLAIPVGLRMVVQHAVQSFLGVAPFDAKHRASATCPAPPPPGKRSTLRRDAPVVGTRWWSWSLPSPWRRCAIELKSSDPLSSHGSMRDSRRRARIVQYQPDPDRPRPPATHLVTRSIVPPVPERLDGRGALAAPDQPLQMVPIFRWQSGPHISPQPWMPHLPHRCFTFSLATMASVALFLPIQV